MRWIHPPDIAFIPNGGAPGPREGDALLFYGGGVGHVALVSRVDQAGGQITVVEENWSPTGEAILPLYGDNVIGIRDSAYGSYTVAGWLHSPRNGAAAR
jgi:surface antigen